MDRLRDSGRRGSLGDRVSMCSYLRRPRSCGGKDSRDDDEVMEDLHVARLRERPKKDSTSRYKRTLDSTREFLLPSRTKEVDEEGASHEVGASEDDEDPRLSRKCEKFRSYGKAAQDAANAVELPAVPRKARTAMAKRHHENRQHEGSRQRYTCPIPYSLATDISPSAGSPLKAVKRMQHSGPKVMNPPKVAMSVTISEQEVEVAEALFDLARMVSNMSSPLSDGKMDSKIENGETKHASSPESTPRRKSPIPTPPSSNSAVSSPIRGPDPVLSSHVPSYMPEPSIEAPLFKPAYNQMESENGILIKQKANIAMGSSATKFKTVPFSREQSAGTRQDYGNLDMKASAANVSTCQNYLHDAPVLVTPLSGSAHLIQSANASISLTWNRSPNIGVSDPPAESAAPAFDLKRQYADECKLVDAGDALAEPWEKKVKIAEAVEYELNLMEQPHSSCNYKDSVEVVKEEGNLLASETILGSSNMEAAKGQNSTGNGREMKNIEVLRQEHTSTTGNCEPEIVQLEEAEGPKGFSHAGYYPSKAVVADAAAAAVSAAWPNGEIVLPPDEKSKMAVKAPLFSFPGAWPLGKRCTTHVYIAHFIDTQQQVQRHPLWTAAYGNNATGGIFSMKTHVPVPPFTLLSGLVGLSTRNSTNMNSGTGHPDDKDSGNFQKEKCAVLGKDGSTKVGASILSETSHPEEQGSSMQAGLERMFGLGDGPPACSEQGGGAGERSASEMCAKMASFIASAGQSSQTESASTAAAQVQYLQAIIQQAGFPFPFPSQQVVPPNASQITIQQPTQYFCNNIYSPHFVTPPARLQQGPATSRAISKMSSLQNQSVVFQDGHGNRIQSHKQPQQPLPLPSSSSSQLHHLTTSQQSQHIGDKQCGETIPSAESKVHAFQNNAHSQEILTVQAFNHTSLSSLRDAALLTSVAPTQVFNMKVSQTSGQVQAQHESSISTHALSHHHLSKSGLPMGVKSINYQAPHVSSSLPMGDVSQNMVCPGLLGVASVAAVMALQGHSIPKTMANTQLSNGQASKEQHEQRTHKVMISSGLEGSRSSNSDVDDKSVLTKQAVTRANITNVDTETASGRRCNLDSKSGALPLHNRQSLPGGSLNYITSLVGSMGAGQVGAASSGPMTSAMPTLMQVGVLQGNNLSNSGSQYSSQVKPVSRLPAGTVNVSAAPSPLVTASYGGYPVARHQGQLSTGLQGPVVSSQTIFSSTPSAAFSFASKTSTTSTVGKATPPVEVPSSFSQRLPSVAALSQRRDSNITHLPAQGSSCTSIDAVRMGQYPQQQRSLQFALKQQQQPQYLNFHQDQFQQLHHSLPQQFNGSGVSSSVPQQYHQPFSGANQVGQAGLPKQLQPHMKRLYAQQHLCQSMQFPDSLQHQQNSKRQQPPFSVASFGLSSSGTFPSRPSSRGSIGSGTGSASSHVTSPISSVCMKSPASTSVSNMQQTPAIFNTGICHLQNVGGACAQPLSSNSVHYLSFSQPATLTSSPEISEKNLGAAYMHPQSGISLSSATSLAGVGRENGAAQYPNSSPIIPTSGNSHSPAVSGTSPKQSGVPHLSANAKGAKVVGVSSQVVRPASQMSMTSDSTATAESAILMGSTTASA